MKKILLSHALMMASGAFELRSSGYTPETLYHQGHPAPNEKRGKFKKSSRNKKSK